MYSRRERRPRTCVGVKGECYHVRSRSPSQKGIWKSGVVVIGSLVFSEHRYRIVVVSYSCPLQGMGLGYPCSTPSRITSRGSRQAARPVCVWFNGALGRLHLSVNRLAMCRRHVKMSGNWAGRYWNVEPSLSTESKCESVPCKWKRHNRKRVVGGDERAEPTCCYDGSGLRWPFAECKVRRGLI